MSPRRKARAKRRAASKQPARAKKATTRPARASTAAKRPARPKKPASRRPARARQAAGAVPAAMLVRLLTEARRRTGAEAGTVYLRDADTLRFAVVQNDLLERRVGRAAFQQRLQGERLPLDRVSIAAWVARTRSTVNLPAAPDTPLGLPYTVDRRIDRRLEYITRSMLATPLRGADGTVLGVLQLINALDRRGRVVSFDRSDELAVAAMVEAVVPR